MSIYKTKGSPFYRFDFEYRGKRFCGSTRKTSRREAQQVEKLERGNAQAAAAPANRAALADLREIAGRYWLEVGRSSTTAKTLERDLQRLLEFFGADKLVAEISDDDVAKLVAWRRQHHVVRDKEVDPKKTYSVVSNATVNRSATELLKRICRRARDAWGIKFDREPRWSAHRLPEPEERVRELMRDEAERIEKTIPEDYRPFFAFARATGLRLRECLMKWSEVNWETRQIVKFGKGNKCTKGGKRITAPVTPTIAEILEPLRGHDAEHVFTVRVFRRKELIGRNPMTYSGVKSVWRRMRERAGVKDFRFHDFRHDFGSKLLRQTKNLKLVQKALNHSDIRTTARYAHVLDSEVADALEKLASRSS